MLVTTQSCDTVKLSHTVLADIGILFAAALSGDEVDFIEPADVLVIAVANDPSSLAVVSAAEELGEFENDRGAEAELARSLSCESLPSPPPLRKRS